jgi:peptide/nickel transport system permease protein
MPLLTQELDCKNGANMSDLKDKKKKIPIKYKRLYRQFKIFYNNIYGKIGLFILLIFAIIALLTPLIVIEPNFSATAPLVDTTTPSVVYEAGLNSNSILSHNTSPLFLLPTTDTSPDGANQILFSSSSGTLYSLCVSGPNLTSDGKLYKVYNSKTSLTDNSNYTPIVATLENCKLLARGTLQLDNFVVMPLNDDKMTVGMEGSTTTKHIQPSFKFLYNLSFNGRLLTNIKSNALPYNRILYSNPSFYYEGIGAASDGQIFFINSSKSGDILNDYSIYPENNLWEKGINLTGTVKLGFLGSGFGVNQYNNFSELLVYNNTSIFAYNSINGAPIWNITSGLHIKMKSGLDIPQGQEEIYTGNNYAFFINNNNTVVDLNLISGSLKNIFTSPSNINSISLTGGRGSFPTAVIVTTQSSITLIHKTSSNKFDNVTALIPEEIGAINTTGAFVVSPDLVLVSQSGCAIAVNTTATNSSTVYLWHLRLLPLATHMSNPDLLLDANTGQLEVGLLSNKNYFYLVSAIAVDSNPINPTLLSPTGQPFPLGTEYQGFNVWSQFIGSFEVDWEFGIVIGLYTMGLAVLIAMYVGYKGGISGQIIETISLGIYLTPSLGLLIALTEFFPPNQRFLDLILVIGGLGWPFAAFTLMGIVKSTKSRTYVYASKMFGASTLSILRTDILPNLGPLLLYMLSLSIAGGAGAVSALQFIGIARISLPTWGGMLSDVLANFSYTVTAPFWIYPPIIALTMFIFSFILISRGMDDLTNPRLRRR